MFDFLSVLSAAFQLDFFRLWLFSFAFLFINVLLKKVVVD